MSDIERFARMAFAGRCVLLSGQNLVPGSSSLLASMLSKTLGRGHESADLLALCNEISEPNSLQTSLQADDLNSLHQGALRQIAGIPWGAVISSAFSDHLDTALSEENSDGRRIRHTFLDDPQAQPVTTNPHVMPLVHLASGIEGAGATGSPIYGRRLRRFRNRLIPSFLDSLPNAVGPAQMLCIAGIARNDLIGLELLEEVVSDLDPNNVYWFVSESDQLSIGDIRETAPEIHLIDGSLGDALAEYLADSAHAKIAGDALSDLLDRDALAVSVRDGTEQKLVSFSPRELREFRPHMVLLPDFPRHTERTSIGDRRDEFLGFLRRPRQVPDWSGIAEGYAFERSAYDRLITAVNDRISRLTGTAPASATGRRSGIDRPIFLAGPPASGRTVGLHWLGVQLRRQGVFVVHLIASGDTVDAPAVEKLLRLVETREVTYYVVIADRLDRSSIVSLERRLRSAGRRAIVVGSATQLGTAHAREAAGEPSEGEPRGEEVRIDYQLDDSEQERLETYLRDHGVVTAREVSEQIRLHPELFALLYRMIPESRQNIRAILIDEYQKLVETLSAFRPPPADQPLRGSSLRDQLLAWMAVNEETQDSKPANELTGVSGSPSWEGLASQLPRLVMLFSSLDEPLPFDLLVRRFPRVLQYYAPLLAALERSNLIFEVELDREQSTGLVAANQMVARIVVAGVLPSASQQIQLLDDAFSSFAWRADALPSEAPEQTRLVHLIRSVCPPNGTYQSQFARTEDLRALAELLRKLREKCLFENSSLMLTEGIVLRHLGRNRAGSGRGSASLDLYLSSIDILGRAEEVVAARPPSPARDHELSAILNAAATSLGHTWHELSETRAALDPECGEIVNRVLQYARRSRAYQEHYHPLDIAFWINRDMYKAVLSETDSPEKEREQLALLGNMAAALEAAEEFEALPTDQQSRLEMRQVELKQILSGQDVATELAEDLAQEGRFSGVCLIARDRALDPESGQMASRHKAREALEYLGRFEPRILADESAAALMHRLWMVSQLGSNRLDEGPHAIGCSVGEWEWLERITRSRKTHAGDAPLAYVNFWLAVALVQQGDPRSAVRTLEEIQSATFSYSHRRLNPLILISDLAGNPVEHRCVVRRREGNDALTVFLSDWEIEVQIQRRHQGTSSLVNVQRGDEVSILIGMSYWRPLGVATDWYRRER